MMEVAGDLKAIWFLISALVFAVAWLVRLEGRLNTAIRDVADLQRSVNRLFAKSDKIDVIDKQVATVVGMMKPEALAEYHRSDERVKARLDALEGLCSELKVQVAAQNKRASQ